MKFLSRLTGWLSVVLNLLPLILQVVTAIEQSFPGAVAGSWKKQLVMNAVREAMAASPANFEAAPVEAIEKLADRMIDSTVAHLNAAGVFQHAGAAPTT